MNGRWLSQDPIGENGGVNLYRYCGNTPQNTIDTDGRIPIVIPIAYAVGLAFAGDIALSSHVYSSEMYSRYNPPPGAPLLGFQKLGGKCTVTVFVGHNNDILKSLPSAPSVCSAISGIGCGKNLQSINELIAAKGFENINNFPELPYSVYPIYKPSGNGALLLKVLSNVQSKNSSVETEDTGIAYQMPIGFDSELWGNLPGYGQYEVSMRHSWLRAMQQAREICRSPMKCCSSVAVIFKFLPNKVINKQEFQRAAGVPVSDFETDDEMRFHVRCSRQ